MCFVCVEAREKNGEIGKNLIDQKKRIPSPLVSLKSFSKSALPRREHLRESALLFLEEEEAREERPNAAFG